MLSIVFCHGFFISMISFFRNAFFFLFHRVKGLWVTSLPSGRGKFCVHLTSPDFTLWDYTRYAVVFDDCGV